MKLTKYMLAVEAKKKHTTLVRRTKAMTGNFVSKKIYIIVLFIPCLTHSHTRIICYFNIFYYIGFGRRPHGSFYTFGTCE